MSQVKTLFLDVETNYSVVASWSLWPKYIPHDNILQEWYVICACWKWAGQKTVHSAKTYDQDDKEVILRIKEAIEEADEIVYHNGDRFDFKKLQARALVNGIEPIVKPVAVDTLKQARKHFALTSNRLDYIGKILGVGGKIDTSNELWLKALRGEKKAINYMVKYCKEDVRLLERVYDKMKPYMDVGVNRSVFHQRDLSCPRCSSNRVMKQGTRRTKTGEYQRYKCKDCGSWSSGQENLNKGAKPLR